MTNQSDSFIDEVTADLRRDRLFRATRRYGWIVALVIVGIVAGSAWYEYSRVEERKSSEAFGDAVLAAGSAEDPAAALATVDTAGSTGRRTIAGLLAAGALAEKGEGAQAAADLRALADSAGTQEPLLRDLALLKAVMAAGPDMDAAERDAALATLARPGAPFELLALEQQAVALVGAGRTEDAVMLIRQIQQKDGLSEPLRRRLAELMITLGAEPDPEISDIATTQPGPAN